MFTASEDHVAITIAFALKQLGSRASGSFLLHVEWFLEKRKIIEKEKEMGKKWVQ